MPVPNQVIFGRGRSYGEVRGLDHPNQYVALKERLDDFLVSQIDELGIQTNGQTKVGSPFPLLVVTCVAIGSLGEVFFRRKYGNSEDATKNCFIAVCCKIDQRLARKLPIEFKKALEATWPDKDIASTNSPAELIYKFLRNTMIHGYRAQAVFVTGDETPDFELRADHMIINPYWFWKAFKKPYEELFVELFKAQANSSIKASCDTYLNKLLN
jgi:hypothetical protein